MGSNNEAEGDLDKYSAGDSQFFNLDKQNDVNDRLLLTDNFNIPHLPIGAELSFPLDDNDQINEFEPSNDENPV